MAMILITGASAGIGEAAARLFAENGYDLLLTARRKDRLEAMRAELSDKHRVKVHAIALDVSRPKDVETFAKTQADLLSQVTVLINNAGLAKGLQPIQEIGPESWDPMIDTNIKGLLAMTRTVLPYFLKKNEGHIFNLGSVAGHHTYPKGNVYSATKFAVHALTESMRLDLNGTKIRVTEISPGMVETEFSEVRLGDRDKAKAVYAGMQPLKARDVAECMLWSLKRPAHVNIAEIVLYPVDQASVTLVNRKN